MDRSFLIRLRIGLDHPMTVGLFSFATTVALILSQPATGIA